MTGLSDLIGNSTYCGPFEKPKSLHSNLIPPYTLYKECQEANLKDPDWYHFPIAHEIPEIGTLSWGSSKQTPTQLRCQSCSRVLVKLLRCSRCRKAYYCNTTCQTKDWVSHKVVCSHS